MRTLRRLVASVGAALVLGLALTGVTLAADPIEVDLGAILEADGQAELDLDLLDDRTDADADIDVDADIEADVILDADAALDADADIGADVDITADAWANLDDSSDALVDADAVVDGDADADIVGDTDLADSRVRGFLALDVCARLALLAKTGPCDAEASGAPSTGDAIVNADADATLDVDAALDAAFDDESDVLEDAGLVADAAADVCLRAAIFGDAGACSAGSAPGGASPDDDEGAVEAIAKLATAADAAVTDEGTAATAALDACASLAIFGDASGCGAATAPDDGDSGPDDGGTGPGTDDPGTAPDDEGTAPGAVTQPDSAAGNGPGGSLPDTASMLVGEPLVPLVVFLGLLALSAVLRRMRGAMG